MTGLCNGGNSPLTEQDSALKLIRQQWPLRHVYAHYRQALRWNIGVLRRVRGKS